MIMKKIISFILLITMCTTLTSCEQKETPEELKNIRVHITNPYVNKCFEVKRYDIFHGALEFETIEGDWLETNDYIIIHRGSKCPICDKEKGE